MDRKEIGAFASNDSDKRSVVIKDTTYVGDVTKESTKEAADTVCRLYTDTISGCINISDLAKKIYGRSLKMYSSYEVGLVLNAVIDMEDINCLKQLYEDSVFDYVDDDIYSLCKKNTVGIAYISELLFSLKNSYQVYRINVGKFVKFNDFFEELKKNNFDSYIEYHYGVLREYDYNFYSHNSAKVTNGSFCKLADNSKELTISKNMKF